VLIVTEGMASQDVALAYRAYCEALARGAGVPLPAGRVDSWGRDGQLGSESEAPQMASEGSDSTA
jgi:hypothetical protein